MQPNDVIALVFTRNQFYKRFYFLALGVFGMSLLIMAALVAVLISVKRNPPAPVYFATDDVTRLIKVIPATQPNMSMEDVVAWTKEAVEKTYAYDYLNYREQLQNAQKYFTQYGWDRYMAALRLSDNLLALKKYKYVINAQVVSEPTLMGQAYVGGALAWKFQMPLLVTYLQPPYDGSEGSTFSNALIVTVIVQRQPILQSYKGLGILQLIATLNQNGTQ